MELIPFILIMLLGYFGFYWFTLELIGRITQVDKLADKIVLWVNVFLFGCCSTLMGVLAAMGLKEMIS